MWRETGERFLVPTLRYHVSGIVVRTMYVCTGKLKALEPTEPRLEIHLEAHVGSCTVVALLVLLVLVVGTCPRLPLRLYSYRAAGDPA